MIQRCYYGFESSFIGKTFDLCTRNCKKSIRLTSKLRYIFLELVQAAIKLHRMRMVLVLNLFHISTLYFLVK